MCALFCFCNVFCHVPLFVGLLVSKFYCRILSPCLNRAMSLSWLYAGVSVLCALPTLFACELAQGGPHTLALTISSRVHQEITASIQSPSENKSDHPEPTRKASRACEKITITINNSNHPEPIRGNGNASRAHQVPFTTPLPVDHLLGKLFKYLTRCGRGARAVRILPLRTRFQWLALTYRHPPPLSQQPHFMQPHLPPQSSLSVCFAFSGLFF